MNAFEEGWRSRRGRRNAGRKRRDNVFDNHYYTYGTFFDTTDLPNFGNGGNPFTDLRSLTPARPRAFTRACERPSERRNP